MKGKTFRCTTGELEGTWIRDTVWTRMAVWPFISVIFLEACPQMSGFCFSSVKSPHGFFFLEVFLVNISVTGCHSRSWVLPATLRSIEDRCWRFFSFSCPQYLETRQLDCRRKLCDCFHGWYVPAHFQG